MLGNHSSAKMRGRNDSSQGKRLVLSVCLMLVALSLVCTYYGSFLKAALQNKSDSAHLQDVEEMVSRRFGRNAAENDDEKEAGSDLVEGTADAIIREKVGEGSNTMEDNVFDVTIKTFPTCDMRLSEVIPCLDANVRHQLKLKLNQSLMEHYERHCPPAHRRLNCLVPPPSNYKNRWEHHLPLVQAILNDTYSSSIGRTPYEAAFGKRFSSLLTRIISPSIVVESYSEIMESVKDRVAKAQEAYTRQANKSRREVHYKVGDWVYLRIMKQRLKQVGRRCLKLSFCSFGPFPIIKEINAVSFQLRLSTSWTMHNVFHVSWLKPYFDPPLEDVTDEQQPEVLDEAELPIQWPAGRDEVWQSNVPHTFLAEEKSDQHWMTIKGDKVNFPGGGTHFHKGADKYIASLAKMLKYDDDNLSNHGKLRTVLDVGCGVASFGAYLLPLDILAMSVAPNDVHENQIQFALERGIPSTLGILGTKRLPFPSKSFDLAHCSRCRIDWLQRDGILLLEVDRLLRPGGFFAWSSPPAYRDDAKDVQIWNDMSDLVKRMCWVVAAKEGQTVIWRKTMTDNCYKERPEGTAPPLCDADEDPDAAWDVPMKPCISQLSRDKEDAHGTGLTAWPNRLTSPPPRLKDLAVSEERFQKDDIVWRSRVEYYWNQMSSEIEEHTFRNVMDMKAHFGGFAAALSDKPVWVMNVVQHSGPNTLKIIYDRGLIGSLHNWCESFSTYPRTYDLLHAWNVFSDIENQGCSSMEDLLLEMDRIVRPMGFVIIRDKGLLIEQISTHLTALHWDSWSKVVNAESDDLSTEDERILFARKQLWVPEDDTA
ncbi:hypothetical protein L7F22_000317 [Adiantum nelumboides]|nr:hypothetical protein [Adiantum nelumboides]